MLYSIQNSDDLEKLEGSASLQNQMKELRLQDKLVKQNLQDYMKKLFEQLSKQLKMSLKILEKLWW